MPTRPKRTPNPEVAAAPILAAAEQVARVEAFADRVNRIFEGLREESAAILASFPMPAATVAMLEGEIPTSREVDAWRALSVFTDAAATDGIVAPLRVASLDDLAAEWESARLAKIGRRVDGPSRWGVF